MPAHSSYDSPAVTHISTQTELITPASAYMKAGEQGRATGISECSELQACWRGGIVCAMHKNYMQARGQTSGFDLLETSEASNGWQPPVSHVHSASSPAAGGGSDSVWTAEVDRWSALMPKLYASWGDNICS
jgi:hypothetical protein